MVSLPVAGTLTYREWHAFLDGFYVGYTNGDKAHEYTAEKHYWRCGFILADIITND